MAASDNALEIPVLYKNQDLSFPAVFFMSGYTHKIQVEVAGQQIMFEPDEEGNYRAILDTNQLETSHQPDVGLLKAISAVLDSVIK